jgi:SAM-dependent methyltransferase
MNSLYESFVAWYPLLDPVDDHEEEATLDATSCARRCRRAPSGPPCSSLALVRGTTPTSWVRRSSAHLVDPAPTMLDLSRAQNPDCAHVEGDMRTLRLARTFDAVLVHDAIVCMLTEVDLMAALLNAFRHLRPGGAALFAPDYVTESFDEGVEPLGDEARTAGARRDSPVAT